MTKYTVYYRGLIEKVGLLYLSSINKKGNKDIIRWLIVGAVYIVGYFLFGLLSSTHSIVISIICTLLFGFIFMYHVINPEGKFGIDNLFEGLQYMLIMSLIGVLFLYSIIGLVTNINNLLNI